VFELKCVKTYLILILKILDFKAIISPFTLISLILIKVKGDMIF